MLPRSHHKWAQQLTALKINLFSSWCAFVFFGTPHQKRIRWDNLEKKIRAICDWNPEQSASFLGRLCPENWSRTVAFRIRSMERTNSNFLWRPCERLQNWYLNWRTLKDVQFISIYTYILWFHQKWHIVCKLTCNALRSILLNIK